MFHTGVHTCVFDISGIYRELKLAVLFVKIIMTLLTLGIMSKALVQDCINSIANALESL